ncbi:MAG: ABC transporter ATP-binding protein [Oscillospiraceae bacterium]|nr:ABC transporter ATP-binding protein [Oscillospiraceae bacterium]
MSDILTVDKLCKSYEKFRLDNVSFSLEKGKITGFIGRNGAGKTTTLKSLLNFVHPDSGEINFFGKNFSEAENEIKQKIGFVSGGMDCYIKSKLRTISTTTKRFYPEWDEKAYKKYLELFSLDESKTPSQLSAGMKVKYSLALALSHNAQLLILDEPTSGLDPVSRDELLDVFLELCSGGKTILFSTHITSDLDKCADNIIYIKNGRILAQDNMEHYTAGYRLLELDDEGAQILKDKLIGCKKSRHGWSALIKTMDCKDIPQAQPADLEDIMVHMEKEEE